MFEQSETLSLGVKLLSLLPFFFTWFIFTLIYTIVPNKKVDIRYSACGALIAAIFFTLGKQAFTWYILHIPFLSTNLWRNGNITDYAIVDSD